MQITGFSAGEREMSYVLFSSTEAATKIKSRLPCPCRAPSSHWPLMSPATKKNLRQGNLTRGKSAPANYLRVRDTVKL